MECEYGCGQQARYRLANGKWCCSLHYQSCPCLRMRNSNGIKRNTHRRVWNKGLTKFTSDKVRSIGHVAWNKGLTAETSPIIAAAVRKLKQGYRDKKLIPSFLGRKHKKDTIEKIRKANTGGYHRNGGRGIRGWYKGYYCDSSWELAYVIYNIEHGIEFKRNTKGFEYTFNGRVYKFYPDFILADSTYVEIKGYMDSKNKVKISSFKYSLIVIDKKGIRKYLDYVIDKYGKNFVTLYKK